MPKIALSDVGLRSLRLPERGQVDYWDEKFPAFGVRVSQGGAKTFVLNIHNSRRAIGRYPILSLAEARGEAKRLMAEKTLGKIRPERITFTAALDLFLDEKQKTRRPSTHQNHRLRLNQHFHFSGQLADYSHQEVRRRLARIDTNAEHDHALSVAKTFFTWAMNRRYIDDNPVRGIIPHGHTSRARVLTDDELRKVWRAAGELGKFGTIVRLLILTGQRRTEIASLQTSWIKNDHLNFPAAICKNGREHSIPLGAVAASALKSVMQSSSTPFLFPARGGSGKCFNGWSKSKVTLDEFSGVTGYTLHDLRRTFATRIAAFTAPHVVEKLLNHVSGQISGVAAIYNRHQYEEECRATVTEWERRLLAIVNRTE